LTWEANKNQSQLTVPPNGNTFVGSIVPDVRDGHVWLLRFGGAAREYYGCQLQDGHVVSK
jgi:hypothetical protein